MLSLIQKTTLIFFIFNILLLATTPSYAQLIYTHQTTYDQVPLCEKTWQEVDMSYWTTINGKPYLNTINLLRPQAYLNKYHMDQVGRKITLTLPEIGLNHTLVKITTIKPAPTFKSCQQKTCSQVIGLFKHYANHVKTYRFKDLTTGNISIIYATPNHPFYIKNKQEFLPISQVTGNDQLMGKKNHTIKLVCKTNQIDHCGIDYNNQKPTLVYNLEVYQQHNYTVGQSGILVHNAPCGHSNKKVFSPISLDIKEVDRANQYYQLLDQNKELIGSTTYNDPESSDLVTVGYSDEEIKSIYFGDRESYMKDDEIDPSNPDSGTKVHLRSPETRSNVFYLKDIYSGEVHNVEDFIPNYKQLMSTHIGVDDLGLDLNEYIVDLATDPNRSGDDTVLVYDLDTNSIYYNYRDDINGKSLFVVD